jgi:hypothetical protein
MLKPDDIQAIRERDETTGEIRVSAGPKFLAEIMASSDEAAVGLEAAAKGAVWHRVYGELEDRLARLRRSVVMPNLGLDSIAVEIEVEKAFREVEALVKNPFSGPDAALDATLDDAPSTGHYDGGSSGDSAP